MSNRREENQDDILIEKCFLDTSHIPQMLELQENVLDNTLDEKKIFLVERSEQDLKNVFGSGQRAIGVFFNGELKAQATITNTIVRPDSLTGSFNKTSENLEEARLSTIGFLMTSPTDCGRGLGRLIVAEWESISKASSADIVHARVHHLNTDAQNLFAKFDLSHNNTAYRSPDRDENVFYMYKQILS